MSNAMSVSKSRWSGALLAGAAAAVLAPSVVSAQSMSVSVYANPLGTGTSPNVYSGKSNVYIDPYDTDTLYVYATVTGTAAPSASYVDGLNFLYFNVNAATTNVAGLGIITAATPGPLFGGGSFNQTSGNTSPSAGAQGGLIGTAAYNSSSSIAVGSNTNLGNMIKPRSPGDVFVNSSTGSGSNIVVNGNSVSFLVETLTYKPTSAAITANPSTVAAPNSVSFNVSTPTPAVSTYSSGIYPGSNYFVGLPSTPAVGASVGASNTSTGYTASTSSIRLTNALPGDANLDGTVNFTDLGAVLQNYTLNVTSWTQGDFNHDGVVNFTDLGAILQNYTLSLGSAPTIVAVPLAVIDDARAVSLLKSDGINVVAEVPEPASLGLMGLAALGALSRRRKS